MITKTRILKIRKWIKTNILKISIREIGIRKISILIILRIIKIKNASAKNVVYDITYDFLTDKGIDHKTANKTIKLMINKDIDLCRLKDIKNQFSHMMNKLTHEEVDNHNNFAAYFVNGLEMRT